MHCMLIFKDRQACSTGDVDNEGTQEEKYCTFVVIDYKRSRDRFDSKMDTPKHLRTTCMLHDL